MSRPFRSGELVLDTEVAAAVEDLRAWVHGQVPPNADGGVLIGSAQDFAARFLAWIYLARTVIEQNGVEGTVAQLMGDACARAVNDEETGQHLEDSRAVVEAQEGGDAEAVDEALARFEGPTSQIPAIGMAVLTAREAVRRASARANISKEQVLDRMVGAGS
ncbi:MAG TPA: hypothetical protein VGR90_01360 [Acidimicrobiales bacterium]|nr:hypothetical protein [Acidimicrobiales bacterium]